MRSFTEPNGFWLSSLARMRTSGLGDSAETSTRGVLPINSSTLWFTRLTVSIDAGSLSDNPDGLSRQSTRSAPGRAIGHVIEIDSSVTISSSMRKLRSAGSSCCRLTIA